MLQHFSHFIQYFLRQIFEEGSRQMGKNKNKFIRDDEEIKIFLFRHFFAKCVYIYEKFRLDEK